MLPLPFKVILKLLSFFKFDFLVPFYFYLSDMFRILVDRILISKNGNVHPKQRIMKYYDYFKQYISLEDSVLDVGSNIGSVSYELAKSAKIVVGVEIDSGCYNWALKNKSAMNIEYVNQNILDYNPNIKFDLCVMSNVLEHIEERIKILKKVKELSPKLAIRVPAIDRDWSVPYRKEIGMEWRCDETHFIEYTDEDLLEELRSSGWKLVDYKRKWGEIYAYCER